MNKNQLIVRKHSAVIQVSVKELSLTQRKLINSLIYLAQKSKVNGPIFYTTVADLKKMCGINMVGNDDLKIQLKELADIKIEFNYLDKDKHNVWTYMSLLAEVKVKEFSGEVMFAFPPTMQSHILKPSMYAPLDIVLTSGFKSSYSVVLYELLRDFLGKDYLGTKLIPKLSVSDLRELLGIKEQEYKLFQDLKKRVLNVAIEEINEKSDISCRYELIKAHKTYTHIQFYAQKKEMKQLIDYLPEINKCGDQKPAEPINEEIKIEIPAEIIAAIPEKYRIGSLIEEIEKKLKEGKNIDYIKINLKYAFKKAKENPLFYAMNALKNNYAGFDIEVEEKKARDKKANLVVEQTKENKAKAKEKILDTIRSLSPEKYEALYQAAKWVNMEENPNNHFFIRDSVIESKMVELYIDEHDIEKYSGNDID